MSSAGSSWLVQVLLGYARDGSIRVRIPDEQHLSQPLPPVLTLPLNTTVIGDYNSPTVRLPGSGGACEIATNALGVMYIMRPSTRSFVERLDFCTSPGHTINKTAVGAPLVGALLPGGGPQRVITDKAIFDFNNVEHEMQLVSLHPGTTLQDVQSSIGWEIRIAPDIIETTTPTSDELHLLRTERDPHGLYR